MADESAEGIATTEAVLRDLGHEVVGREVAIDAAAETAEQAHADAAVVAVRHHERHALELVERITDTAPCPVVLLVDEEKPDFVGEAADRGILAYANRQRPESLAAALAIAKRRFAELRDLGGQLRGVEDAVARRAKIEQAKGVLMERHDVSATEAFEILRQTARRERRRVVDVADAVITARPVLPGPVRDGGGER